MTLVWARVWTVWSPEFPSMHPAVKLSTGYQAVWCDPAELGTRSEGIAPHIPDYKIVSWSKDLLYLTPMFLGFHPLSPGHACNCNHLHSMASQLHSSSLGTGPYKWPRSQYCSSCCQWTPRLRGDSQVHIWQHLLVCHNSVLSPAPIRIITGFTWQQSTPAMDMQRQSKVDHKNSDCPGASSLALLS